MPNHALNRARRDKNDEFYTRLVDVEKECQHYLRHFAGKTVYLNCDNPEWSAFWEYFNGRFDELGLVRVISTHFDKDKPTYKLETYRDAAGRKRTKKTALKQNGDFRSPECVELLKEADIVVTNPPFSLFREYIAQLVEYGKKFLIMGNNNSVTYKEVFALIMANKLWLGHNCNKTMEFGLHESYEKWDRVDENGRKYGKVPCISWFTNLPHKKWREGVRLCRYYDPSLYPRYVNYDAIEVSKVRDIPQDYEGDMGVPITFLGKYNPEQFEIVGSSRALARPMSEFAERGSYSPGSGDFCLAGVCGGYIRLYNRIVIRNRKPTKKGATA